MSRSDIIPANGGGSETISTEVMPDPVPSVLSKYS